MLSILALVVLVLFGLLSNQVNALPKFTWDHISLYAHCGNASGELSPETIDFFSKLSFVTLEKWHKLYSYPEYTSAEKKIAETAKLIKSFQTEVEVLMYYQNDWTRTWYDSGTWFEQHEKLLLKDKYGMYICTYVN